MNTPLHPVKKWLAASYEEPEYRSARRERATAEKSSAKASSSADAGPSRSHFSEQSDGAEAPFNET